MKCPIDILRRASTQRTRHEPPIKTEVDFHAQLLDYIEGDYSLEQMRSGRNDSPFPEPGSPGFERPFLYLLLFLQSGEANRLVRNNRHRIWDQSEKFLR